MRKPRLCCRADNDVEGGSSKNRCPARCSIQKWLSSSVLATCFLGLLLGAIFYQHSGGRQQQQRQVSQAAGRGLFYTWAKSASRQAECVYAPKWYGDCACVCRPGASLEQCVQLVNCQEETISLNMLCITGSISSGMFPKTYPDPEVTKLYISSSEVSAIEDEAFAVKFLADVRDLVLQLPQLVVLSNLTFQGLPYLAELTLSDASGLRIVSSDVLAPVHKSLLSLSISGLQPDVAFDILKNLTGTVELTSLATLDLRFNDIRHISSDMFKGATSAMSVYLSNAGIRSVVPSTFSRFTSLEQLFLSSNYLKVLDARILQDMPYWTRVWLENNPWNCSCSLPWWQAWLASGRLSGPPLTCRYPKESFGKYLTNVTDCQSVTSPQIISVPSGTDYTTLKTTVNSVTTDVTSRTSSMGTATNSAKYTDDYPVESTRMSSSVDISSFSETASKAQLTTTPMKPTNDSGYSVTVRAITTDLSSPTKHGSQLYTGSITNIHGDTTKTSTLVSHNSNSKSSNSILSVTSDVASNITPVSTSPNRITSATEDYISSLKTVTATEEIKIGDASSTSFTVNTRQTENSSLCLRTRYNLRSLLHCLTTTMLQTSSTDDVETNSADNISTFTGDQGVISGLTTSKPPFFTSSGNTLISQTTKPANFSSVVPGDSGSAFSLTSNTQQRTSFTNVEGVNGNSSDGKYVTTKDDLQTLTSPVEFTTKRTNVARCKVYDGTRTAGGNVRASAYESQTYHTLLSVGNSVVELPSRTEDFFVMDEAREEDGTVALTLMVPESSTLVWAATRCFPGIMGCLTKLSSMVVVDDLQPSESYTFCVLVDEERKVSPFNCLAYSTSPRYDDQPWITNSEKAAAICGLVACMALSLLLGAAILFAYVKRHPTLIKGKRVLVAKHRVADVIILPSDYKGQLLSAGVLQERAASAADPGGGERSARSRSSTISYVTVNEPTALERFAYRFEQMVGRLRTSSRGEVHPPLEAT